MKPPTKFTSIGGQAVIEGVMMRSPHFIAVAVRKPDQKIIVRNQPYQGIAARVPLFKKPVLRGVVMLVESMLQGVQALSFSANVAADEDNQGEELSRWAMVSSVLTALVAGLGLFVVLPHFLSATLASAQNPFFHLVDGLLKLLILLGYVYFIAWMKDVHRVFQYHGAEHKSIYTFEAGEELTVENARKYTTLHPRCGTSFLFFLILISVLVFSVVFPVFGLTHFSTTPILNHLAMLLVKVVLMLPIAGLSYEFIRMCACRMESPLFRVMIWPGMILQKLTTREPSDDQLEVALASLRQVLRLEKGQQDGSEHEISRLVELAMVPATVAEFPEG